jgi:RsmE family RNA methyltransferase
VNLILLETGQLRGARALLTGVQARHSRDVLRVAPGDTVRIGLVDGPKGIGRILASNDQAVELECTFEADPPPAPDLDLLLALPRPKVMRRLWAQLAALGVGRIVLTNAARVERNYFDTHVLDPVFYRGLLVEGLQQAQDTRVPRVSVHRRFKVLIEDELDALCPTRARFVAHPAAQAAPIASAWRSDDRALLAIGPEGGWDDYELRLLESRGFQAVALGARTLRTDTACIALLTALRGGRL